MKPYKKILVLLLGILLLALTIFVLIRFYSFVFAKSIVGEVIAIERVTQTTTILSPSASQVNAINPAQLYSFAVAIKNKKGEIATSSSEDRQWSIVQKGNCVEAKFFPYPFWELDKGNTYFGARLERLFDCKELSN
jgi:hypothetical protein